MNATQINAYWDRVIASQTAGRKRAAKVALKTLDAAGMVRYAVIVKQSRSVTK